MSTLPIQPFNTITFGSVEIHNPIHAARDNEKVGAFLSEERIAFNCSDKPVDTFTADKYIVTRHADDCIVP